MQSHHDDGADVGSGYDVPEFAADADDDSYDWNFGQTQPLNYLCYY